MASQSCLAVCSSKGANCSAGLVVRPPLHQQHKRALLSPGENTGSALGTVPGNAEQTAVPVSQASG